ncbi:MAG: lytic transglycosylase domain-containing protein [Deltaproteobacteria bacterium]|nr:lytic transglycosylase domain-containing protein [Deltaproteobacteria bacterium]
MRRGQGVLLAIALSLPNAAGGDELIARRLAALKAIADPGAVRAARAARPARDVCSGSRWWRLTEYGLRSRIDTAVRDASLRYGVEPKLVRSVIRHESNFDPDAVSRVGAIGLMQLMPQTAAKLGVVCPYEPRENVLAGTRYLRDLYLEFGRWPEAIAAYNAGPARVSSGRIPAETRVYVRRVIASWRPQLLAHITF